jgi:uncharacterized membrane protein YdbT with pleckstrin-like domain
LNDTSTEQAGKSNPVLEHLQPSALVIVLKLLAVLFMLDTLYSFLLLGFLGLNDAHEWHNTYVALLWLTNTVKYVFISTLVIRLFADWCGHTYYLAGHHLIERIGLINITETTYEMSQIKSIIIQQSWFGRRFNFGTIKLTFAGAGKDQSIIVRDINNPTKYKEYFDNHLQVQGWVR